MASMLQLTGMRVRLIPSDSVPPCCYGWRAPPCAAPGLPRVEQPAGDGLAAGISVSMTCRRLARASFACMHASSHTT